MLTTKRLILRPWTEADAEALYTCAKDPAIGPPAGWPPHRSVADSLSVIQTVFTGKACFAICEMQSNKAIGAIELKLKGHTDMTDRDDECELGYWLGKPYWGKGYMAEAVQAVLDYGFSALNMNAIWCGYYEGNLPSKKVQEKAGFLYHHTCHNVSVPLLNEIRTCHISLLTKDRWETHSLSHTV